VSVDVRPQRSEASNGRTGRFGAVLSVVAMWMYRLAESGKGSFSVYVMWTWCVGFGIHDTPIRGVLSRAGWLYRLLQVRIEQTTL